MAELIMLDEEEEKIKSTTALTFILNGEYTQKDNVISMDSKDAFNLAVNILLQVRLSDKG